MSAPLSGSSGGNPAPGFYPDPSIPGYIRYWNGSSWVPGTSRPEPQEGEGMPTPPSAAASSSAQAPPTREEPAPTEETGPVFLDEEAGRLGLPETTGPEATGPEAPGSEAQVPAARGESALPEVRPRGEVATSGAQEPGQIDWDDPSRLHGQRPEAASSWQADASRQGGFAGQSEERVSWGRAESGESGAPAAADPRGGWPLPADESGSEGRTDAGGPEPSGAYEAFGQSGQSGQTGSAESPGQSGQSEQPGRFGAAADAGQSPEPADAPPREGTVQMRALTPEALRRAAQKASSAGGAGGAASEAQPGAEAGTPGSPPGAQHGAGGGSAQPEHTVGLRRSDVLRAGPGGQASTAPPASAGVPGQGAQGQPSPPVQPQSPGQPPAPAQSPAQSPAQGHVQPPPAAPSVPQQGSGQQPHTPAPQHSPHQAQHQAQQPQQQAQHQAPAQPSWAQQVHDLAGGGAPGGAPGAPAAHGAPAAPGFGPDAHGPAHGPAHAPAGGAESAMAWRPPVADPFLQAAQQEARPAALGKRLAARLVDGVVTGAVAFGAASPFLTQAVDHVQAKIDAVRDAGETKTVWLIDGTTGGYLAVVLGVLLLFGLLYEVVPTQRWGRTLGKRLFGLKVLTMEQQERPGFRGALLRWLTYGVLSVLVVGVVNVLWCVFDRPWRQCWHDKVAGTFVSRDSGEVRL